MIGVNVSSVQAESFGIVACAFLSPALQLYCQVIKGRVLENRYKTECHPQWPRTERQQVCDLHLVLASAKSEEALCKEFAIPAAERMIACEDGLKALFGEFGVVEVSKDVAVSDESGHCPAALKDDVRACAAQIGAVGCAFHAVADDCRAECVDSSASVMKSDDWHEMGKEREDVVERIPYRRVGKEARMDDEPRNKRHL